MYREEFRAWASYAAASVTILVGALAAVWTLAKDVPLELLALLPLVFVSYGALVTLLLTYAAAAQVYSELLERKMNALLGSDDYIFERRYSVFRGFRADRTAYLIVGAVMMLAPLVISTSGVARDSGPWWAGVTTVLLLIVLLLMFAMVHRTVRRREALNEDVFKEWTIQTRRHNGV